MLCQCVLFLHLDNEYLIGGITVFVSYLIRGIIFEDMINLSGGFYYLVPHQGNLVFAIFLSVGNN